MLALKENGNKELTKRYIRPEGPTLAIVGEFSLEEYEQVGVTLSKGERFIGFWVGDWANAAAEEHGVGAMKELAPKVNYKLGTMYEYAATARAYASPIRIGLVEKYSNLSFRHFQLAKSMQDRLKLLEMAGRENMGANDFYRYLYPENGRGTTLPFWRTLDDTRTYVERQYSIMRANPAGIQENKKNAKALLKEARGLVAFLEEALS